jgi:hypothetical protein
MTVELFYIYIQASKFLYISPAQSAFKFQQKTVVIFKQLSVTKELSSFEYKTWKGIKFPAYNVFIWKIYLKIADLNDNPIL